METLSAAGARCTRRAFCERKGYLWRLFDSMLEEPRAGLREALHIHQPKIVAIYEERF